MAEKFRKKPVVIEAIRYTGSTSQAIVIQRWMKGHEYVDPGVRTRDLRHMAIPTLEGTMSAAPGDWIIRGVAGEFYPCKPDIFAETYEPATTSGVRIVFEDEAAYDQAISEAEERGARKALLDAAAFLDAERENDVTHMARITGNQHYWNSVAKGKERASIILRSRAEQAGGDRG
ncbi:MAG: hypothetical protein FWF90_11485 [Promicromonosporaceae bacterium]|nr:hypothetical protein [Promicromonosporaceae bacterium]